MFDLDPRTSLAPITALPHAKGDKVDLLLAEAADALRGAGHKVAGVVQHARAGQAACCSDFYLEDLATGTQYEISQRLGREARGCRLNYGVLAAVHAAVESSLRDGAVALILNRFGYSESRGQGLRPLIEHAVSAGLPVLISVNDTYRPEWQAFIGDFAQEIAADRGGVLAWADAVLAAIRTGKGPNG
ncbi:DUF2478 domain-containing protein [Maritimibacter sp. HL-12]|uniref:DUF2478 domain-containing protein n=1 Tax=Maritimibacter sp. HL-12 TaxID=1162418 RepID=UPI000A0EFF47|nr:DUF2478 domain-containing protein [Maritimibacter sp. HL-12]SMH50620.1 Protein of unknown function [Maritimibacter sp. HL-12]